jgi:hypothetical protein
MLDQERISIGKLKFAFELSEQDVETVISALWPHGILPYALWEMAYKSHWKDAASHNTIYYKAKALSPFPDFNPLEYPLPLLHIYRGKLASFFTELAAKIFVTDLMDGLHRVIEWAYENTDEDFEKDVEYLCDGLSRIESHLDFGIGKPFTWATQITSEIFNEVFEDKCIFLASCPMPFVSREFLDTVIMDKIAAIRFLLLRGYPLRHEVKGISRALVERIEATLTDEHQIKPVTEAFIDLPHDDAFKNPSPSVIFVPRSLWEGKSPKSVRDNMRQPDMDFPDHVIAYVLYNWCDLKNMTEIGTLLGEADKVPSTYLRYAHRLLAKAETLNIQPA